MEPDESAQSPVRCPSCGAARPVPGGNDCAACGNSLSAGAGEDAEGSVFWSVPAMTFGDEYTWLVLVAALDVLLTLLALTLWNGYELNPITRAVLETLGLFWAMVFKFGVVVFVVVVCEVIGRREETTGRTLARAAVALNAIPVAYSFVLLLGAGPPTLTR